jgi:DNA-binding NarL/FixJ family response regulator
MRMKLLIVDDHSILREGVAEILRQSEAKTEVLQAQTIAQGLTLAAQHDDLSAILLDISFPGASGLSGIGEFAAITAAPVIILSSSEDAGVVRQALHLGARGYVAKSASSQTLVAALHKVLAGQLHIPPFAQTGEMGSSRGGGLTQRQLEVLQAICGGLSNKDIGLKLELSEKTVKVHVTAIFRALNVVNRTQAVNAARAAKLIAS